MIAKEVYDSAPKETEEQKAAALLASIAACKDLPDIEEIFKLLVGMEENGTFPVKQGKKINDTFCARAIESFLGEPACVMDIEILRY